MAIQACTFQFHNKNIRFFATRLFYTNQKGAYKQQAECGAKTVFD